MHRYASDESRVGVYGTIGLVAIGGAWLVSLATSWLSWPEWVISAPSFAGVFALLYRYFDSHGWRHRAARKLRLSTTPDVSGTYEGEVLSTFEGSDGERVKRPVRIEIHQSWTHIAIRTVIGAGTERSSTSRSVAASVSGSSDSAHLVYFYRNQVNPGVADADMGDHDGAAEVEVESDGSVTGRYFNSRPRSGSIDARRIAG